MSSPSSLPLPFVLSGIVVHGFGRGGSQLGYPTANIELSTEVTCKLQPYSNCVLCGWGSIDPSTLASSPTANDAVDPPVALQHPNATTKTLDEDLRADADGRIPVYPFAMSIGFNPHFKNKALTAEVYFLHSFSQDFYGATVRIISVAGLREQAAFTTLEALIDMIRGDVVNTKRLLGIAEDVSSAAPGGEPAGFSPLSAVERLGLRDHDFLQPLMHPLESSPHFALLPRG